MARKGILAAVVVLLALASPAHGCLWDYDTLRDEKRGLPGMAEILAGQWERHSRFFYQHRVAAMRAKLAARSDDWDAMDNLAVAHAKLDDLDAAIAVMLDKEKRHPGQYTTASNLGTFYMFKGALPAAIAQLKKALAINPNAHFGREEYQLRLAEFLQRAKADPTLEDDDFLELRRGSLTESTHYSTTGPAATQMADGDERRFLEDHFLYNRHATDLSYLGVKPNVFDGLVGMIRFGTNRSPELYFALGDLLAARGDKNLAFRAYKRSLELNHPRPEAVQGAMDKSAGLEVPQGGLDTAVIAAERAAADKWVAEYQQFEGDLIRAGKDTDDEANYAPFYAIHPRTLMVSDFFWTDVWQLHEAGIIAAGAIALLVAGAVRLEIRRHRRGAPKRRSFRLN